MFHFTTQSMTKKPYYPNNWKKFRDAPAEWFFAPTWEEFESWKIEGWELPDSVHCIIRAEIDGKVKEYTYQRAKAAQNKVKQLLEQGVTFTVCDNESIHFLEPQDDFDEDSID